MNQNYITATETEPQEIRWLWYPYIPFGKVSIFQGNPGDGKSTLMMTIAALLTKGAVLPFTESEELPEPMKVIYQTTEDDLADTVVPRFIRAGGNRENLIFIQEEDRPLTFSDDRIPAVLEETGAKLLILDPLSSYIGDCSMNAANEVRLRFNYLIRVAKETGCAIVIISHMNKKEDVSALMRTVGSIDIVGAVRSVITVIPDKIDPSKRYMVMTKSNLAPMGSGIAFELTENGISFLEEVNATADELMHSYGSSAIGRPDERTQEAVAFIRNMLADGKPHPSAECEQMLKEAGICEGTAKKAKKQLGVVSSKPHLTWFWTLPQ